MKIAQNVFEKAKCQSLVTTKMANMKQKFSFRSLKTSCCKTDMHWGPRYEQNPLVMSWGRRMPIWPFLLASNSIFRRPCQHGPAKTNREWEGERVRFIYSWDWNHKVLPKGGEKKENKNGISAWAKIEFSPPFFTQAEVSTEVMIRSFGNLVILSCYV